MGLVLTLLLVACEPEGPVEEWEGCSGPLEFTDLQASDTGMTGAESEEFSSPSYASWGQTVTREVDELVLDFNAGTRLHRKAVLFTYTHGLAVGAQEFPWGLTAVGPGTVMTDEGSVPWAGVTATFSAESEARLDVEYAVDGDAFHAAFDVVGPCE